MALYKNVSIRKQGKKLILNYFTAIILNQVAIKKLNKMEDIVDF